MNKTTAPLTTADLDRMEQDDRWLGFGYLGERRNAYAAVAAGEVDPRQSGIAERMDEDVLEEANTEGLTYDELFAWANSKLGRWFADSYGTRHAVDYLPTRARVAAILREI